MDELELSAGRIREETIEEREMMKWKDFSHVQESHE